MTEIKPVAWRWKKPGGAYQYYHAVEPEHRHLYESVYDQSAIDALRAENERLQTAINHYEQALLAGFASGAQSATFDHWNQARIVLETKP